MALPGYGILYGTVLTARPPRINGTHWLIVVQPLEPKHPPYRVAIQLANEKIGLQAQWRDLSRGNEVSKDVAAGLLRAYAARNAPKNFLCAADCRTDGVLPGLDYIRSGIVDFKAFAGTSKAKSDPTATRFMQFVQPGAAIVICGTGAPTNANRDGAQSTGYTGIVNVHMNQGTRTWIVNDDRHDENGIKQDGALFVLREPNVHGLFVKYANQSSDTDDNGNPRDSGIASIDRVRTKAQPVLKTFLRAQAAEEATAAAESRIAASPRQAAKGFVFADPVDLAVDDPFVADDDKGVINNPIAQQYAKGIAKAPEYLKGNQSLVMQLESVRGKSFIANLGNSITFDFIGDSGATAASTYVGETQVAAQLCAVSQDEPPAFCFHVGDVVYYYGEANYFPCQFGVPFKDYPAPIFAIPGNHDACVYDEEHKPLETFIKVFCADEPVSDGFLGGVSRTTMTQPGVYFTLDSPFVSIVGLFSGAAESRRYMSAQQIQHFYSELLRLAQLRKDGDKRAIILAVHHLPQFYDASPDAVSKGLDAACEHANLWPDAVVVGHAHLYQRFVRSVAGRQIPYIVCGNGGYRISNGQEARVDGRPQISDNLVKKVLGFVRSNSDGETLTFRALDANGHQMDKFSIDLATRRVSIEG